MYDQILKKKTQNGVKFILGGTKSDMPTKLCTYYKLYVGEHNTNNTIECKKWNKNGNLKKTFNSKDKSSETLPGANKICSMLC